MNNHNESTQTTIITGRATPFGTDAYKQRFPELAPLFHTIGETRLACSPVGFGTYRVDRRVQVHRAALASALRRGVNLIDTSANYADGNSERLIGEVLAAMIELNVVRREEIVVMSKGGYIQGENYDRIRSLDLDETADRSKGSELNELTRYGADLWHSIHPKFLEDQITRSLERLGLETIDLYLLHNPEYYIQWAIREDVPEDEARTEYERRIEQAFRYLETEVERGRIGWYGISSNTFPKPEGSADRTSLEHALQAAQRISSTHHFAAIQLPLNLLESGAVTERNSARATESVIAFADSHRIAVFVNRPLNTLWHGALLRLADVPNREHPPEEDISDLVHDLQLQESEFKNGLLKDISLKPQAYDAVKQLFTLGASLEGKWNLLNSYEEWKDLSQTVLAPRVQYCFDLLRQASKSNKALFEFLTTYAESADEVMEHISNVYATRANERGAALHHLLGQLMPEAYEGLSLSQKAVLIARSVPGVTSVLVGMRNDEYVDDVINGLQAPPLADAERLLFSVRQNQAPEAV